MLVLASFAASLNSPLGGVFWGVIIPLPIQPLSAIHPEGSSPSSSPEGARGGHVVHGPRIRIEGPHQAPAQQDQDPGAHASRLVLTATTIRGDCANSSRGRECRPDESRSPGAPPRP